MYAPRGYDLKHYLKEIVAKEITIKKEHQQQNVNVVNEVMHALRTAMKSADPLFNDLFQRPGYSGSYYEGVRIHDPCEFDLNLILRLPLSSSDVEIIPSGDPADYVQVKLRRELRDIFRRMHPKWTPQLYQRLESFFRGGYLVCDEIQTWMQSVTSKAMNRLSKPQSVYQMTYHRSGPGCTLKVTTSRGEQIDIDVVPVIDTYNLDANGFPPGFDKTYRFNQLYPEARMYYLIPKMGKPRKSDTPSFGSGGGYASGGTYASSTSFPASGGGYDSGGSSFGYSSAYTATLVDAAARNWRVSFPEADKALILGKNSAKLLIKLFKLLRDKQQWSSITSYQIVSMFLWEIDANPSPDYWDEKNLGTLFIQMLRKWLEIISKRSLPYYYARRANLLDKMHPSTAENITNRMERIIRSVTNDPSTVLSYYQ